MTSEESAELHVLYRFFNRDGDLLYIGITRNPWYRFRVHQADKLWFQEVAGATMEHFASRDELAKAEIAAIKTELPKYNGAYMPRECLSVGIRGPGRPEVGTAINVRLGDDLLANVDRWAAVHEVSRAEAIRRLISDGLMCVDR